MPNKFTVSVPAVLLGAFLSVLFGVCHAQTVTVADLLAAKVAKKAAADVTLAPVREKADVWISAVYGADADLKFDVVLNGKSQTVTLGQSIKHEKTTCTLEHYDPVTRCVAITQAKQVGAICPAKACWTGAAAPERSPLNSLQTIPPAIASQLTTISPVNPGAHMRIPAPLLPPAPKGLPAAVTGGRP
jgi:hypothetical protein